MILGFYIILCTSLVLVFVGKTATLKKIGWIIYFLIVMPMFVVIANPVLKQIIIQTIYAVGAEIERSIPEGMRSLVILIVAQIIICFVLDRVKTKRKERS